MIRERVSTQGVIRPLEPPSELSAMTLPPDMIGVISELAARRYIEGRTKYDHKFRREIKAIHRARQKHLDAARKDAGKSKNLAHLQAVLFDDSDKTHGGDSKKDKKGSGEGKSLRDGVAAAGASSWTWAWALDEERPPPSSIVARRDTQEARALARIADSVTEPGSAISGNKLWSIMMTFLTLGPDHSKNAEGAGDRLRTLEEEANAETADVSGEAKPSSNAAKVSRSQKLKEKLGLSSPDGKRTK
jgi:hypothetical protein